MEFKNTIAPNLKLYALLNMDRNCHLLKNEPIFPIIQYVSIKS